MITNSAMSIKFLRVTALLVLAGVITYSVLNSTINVETLIFLGLAALLQIISFFPSKFNYPGKITDNNRTKIYSSAQILILFISLLLSLMALAMSLKIYTTILISILMVVMMFVVLRSSITIFRSVE